ncbi:MAG: site-2 protease family protein [Planctomycetota bacterium]|jgi:Zn-dependent protease
MNLRIALLLLPGLVVGLTVHEAAHAITAKWLGDRNAERMGRVSLNPFRHLSPLGTLALFVFGFGWGRPVIVNLYNFKRPKLYYFLSSIAGPVSNLMLSSLALGILYLRPQNWTIMFLCASVYYINAILAAINLVPIPPLDGSKIWPCLIPGLRPTVSDKWMRIWLVVLVLALWTRSIDYVIRYVFGFLSMLLPESLF